MIKLREMPQGDSTSPVAAARSVRCDGSDGAADSECEDTDSLYLPELFTALPILRDPLATHTSRQQNATIQECLPLLANLVDGDFNRHGVPHIDRRRHARFLHNSLRRLPAGFVSVDSSRPWLLYWSLSALTLLGEDVATPEFRHRLVDTVAAMQNPAGGFGGGFGQLSHLATTYAIVLALALVGGRDAYDAVDRRALWKWMGLLKCPDGGFRMSLGGEEDIRGAYCAAVVISLLNLPLDLPANCPAVAAGLAEMEEQPHFFTGLGEYVRRCQTFEGGISGHPDAEAHGAYAFCALGCLAILDTPRRSIPKYINVPRLVAWLSSRQYAPEGGLSGRTNKLVDGCYAHWVGGCWPLIEACLNGTSANSESDQSDCAQEQGLAPAYESLFSREGLIRYILCCCQDKTKRGGLRDKPSKPSDAYHSCYTLAGLSSAQHQWRASRPDTGAEGMPAEHTYWTVSTCAEPGARIFDEEDRVPAVHPVYAIPEQRVYGMLNYFAGKAGF